MTPADLKRARRRLRLLQDAVGLALAAAPEDGPTADNPEVLHARHH